MKLRNEQEITESLWDNLVFAEYNLSLYPENKDCFISRAGKSIFSIDADAIYLIYSRTVKTTDQGETMDQDERDKYAEILSTWLKFLIDTLGDLVNPTE